MSTKKVIRYRSIEQDIFIPDIFVPKKGDPTYAGRLVQAGVGLYRVQRLLGHSTPIMTARYGKLSDDNLRDAVRAMARDALVRQSNGKKQSISMDYNKRHHRRGTLLGERFKSCIVENGETLINCLSYIDLNPIRAGIFTRPEDYRWNSLGYHFQQNNKDGFLLISASSNSACLMKQSGCGVIAAVYEANAVANPTKHASIAPIQECGNFSIQVCRFHPPPCPGRLWEVTVDIL